MTLSFPVYVHSHFWAQTDIRRVKKRILNEIIVENVPCGLNYGKTSYKSFWMTVTNVITRGRLCFTNSTRRPHRQFRNLFLIRTVIQLPLNCYRYGIVLLTECSLTVASTDFLYMCAPITVHFNWTIFELFVRPQMWMDQFTFLDCVSAMQECRFV